MKKLYAVAMSTLEGVTLILVRSWRHMSYRVKRVDVNVNLYTRTHSRHPVRKAPRPRPLEIVALPYPRVSHRLVAIGIIGGPQTGAIM